MLRTALLVQTVLKRRVLVFHFAVHARPRRTGSFLGSHAASCFTTARYPAKYPARYPRHLARSPARYPAYPAAASRSM
eukprot:2923833-Rhodomonas_salina.1